MSFDDYYATSNSPNDQDAWDEGYLLKAYEQMISNAQQQEENQNNITKNAENNLEVPVNLLESVEREFHEILSRSRMGTMNSAAPYANIPPPACKPQTLISSSQNWNVGDLCQAVYSQDGAIYDAHVCKVNYEEGKALIHFIRLNFKEEKPLKQLIPSGTVPTSPPDYNSDQQKNAANNCSVAHHLLSKFLKKNSPNQLVYQSNRPLSSKPETVSLNGASKLSPNSFRRLNNNANNRPTTSTKPPMKFTIGKATTTDLDKNSDNNNSSLIGSREHKNGPSVNNKKQNDSFPPFPPNLEMLTKSLPGHLLKNSSPTNAGNPLKSMLMSWYMCGYHTGYYEGFKNSQKKP